MNSIFDYTIEMLEEYFLSIGEKKFKGFLTFLFKQPQHSYAVFNLRIIFILRTLRDRFIADTVKFIRRINKTCTEFLKILLQRRKELAEHHKYSVD